MSILIIFILLIIIVVAVVFIWNKKEGYVDSRSRIHPTQAITYHKLGIDPKHSL